MSNSTEEKITYAERMINDNLDKYIVSKLSGLNLSTVEKIINREPMFNIVQSAYRG